MTDQHFEDLAKKWPELFHKAKAESFEIGEGWIPIIDTLCSLISSDVEAAKQVVKFSTEHQGSKYAKNLIEAEQLLAKCVEELPLILQVKEKFGGLKFYASITHNIPEIQSYIRFACEMSMKVCEQCGKPGEPRNDGWTKVLCEHHHRERDLKNSDFDSF